MDSQKRTIVKTLLWRFIASGTTVVVVFALSGNVVLGLTAAAIGIPLKLFMYYFYAVSYTHLTLPTILLV